LMQGSFILVKELELMYLGLRKGRVDMNI